MVSRFLKVIKNATVNMREQIEVKQREQEFIRTVEEWMYPTSSLKSIKLAKKKIDESKKNLIPYIDKYNEILRNKKLIQNIMKNELQAVSTNIILKPKETCYYHGHINYDYYSYKTNHFYVSSGSIYITNKRIIYVGDQTITYYLNKIILYKMLPNEIYFKKENENDVKHFYFSEEKLQQDKGFAFLQMKAIIYKLFGDELPV